MDANSQSSAALSGAVTGGHIYGWLVVYLDDAAGDIDYYMTRPATSTYALYLTCTRLW